jgi:hypothetical protein
MLSIIFHRMEAFDERARQEAQAALSAMQANSSTARKLSTSGSKSLPSPSPRPPADPAPPSAPLPPMPQPPLPLVPPPSPSPASTGALPCGAYMYPAVYIRLGYRPQGNKPISLVPRGGSLGSYGTSIYSSLPPSHHSYRLSVVVK